MVIVVAAAVFLYYTFDPGTSVLSPKCPFHMLTGLDCPGCGSQRAIHSMLNGDFEAALRYNALLVLAIPYLALYALTAVLPRIFRNARLKAVCCRVGLLLFHGKAVWVVLAVVLVFWAGRNIV